MRDTSISRWAMTTLGTALVAVLAAGLSGCGSASTSPDKEGDKAAGEDLVVGFVYVDSKEDYGYSQAHAQGAAAVKKLKGVKVVELEKVLEDDSFPQAVKNLIENEKAKVIFASSYGYYKDTAALAKEYPDVTFVHCGGPWTEGKSPKNLYTYFGYIDECQYIAGIVAGKMTKSNKLGFVAAKPISQVKRNINAFLLGARSVNPEAEVYVTFTGNWSDPTKEAESANLLLGKGCDVFTCHVDGPRVLIEAAEKAKKFSSGYHASQAALAPNGYLTGAEWNWEKVYVDYVTKIQKKEKIPNYLRGGLKEGIVKMSPYSKIVSEDAKKAADEAKKKFMEGDFSIFKGPLKDDAGETVIPAGVSLKQDDPKLEEMKYLVEGVKAAK